MRRVFTFYVFSCKYFSPARATDTSLTSQDTQPQTPSACCRCCGCATLQQSAHYTTKPNVGGSQKTIDKHTPGTRLQVILLFVCPSGLPSLLSLYHHRRHPPPPTPPTPPLPLPRAWRRPASPESSRGPWWPPPPPDCAWCSSSTEPSPPTASQNGARTLKTPWWSSSRPTWRGWLRKRLSTRGTFSV